MERLQIIRLDEKIRSTPFSARALEEAVTALASIKSSVDALRICEAMSQTWQAEVLPFARELLAAKKASDRERGLEMFAHIPDASLIVEVEAAKNGERSKKLLSTYDFAVRRIRKACERDQPPVDPRDTAADPVARMRALANLPYEDLWKLTGLRERYWGHIELPLEDADGSGAAKRWRRLGHFLRSGQTQPFWLAQLLYIAHPLAGESATQVVWEARIASDWVAFRGAPEASVRDVSGKPLPVDSAAEVRLAHPAELAKAELEAWSDVAAAEGWSLPWGQLEVSVFVERDVTLAAAVDATPPLDERRLKAWLAGEGFEPIWVNEHGHPHATAHVTKTDGDETWLRIHHDAIVARRAEATPIRIKKLEVVNATKRRHSEAVRVVHDLVADAGMA